MPVRDSRNPLWMDVKKMRSREMEGVDGRDHTVWDAEGLACLLAQSAFPVTTNEPS